MEKERAGKGKKRGNVRQKRAIKEKDWERRDGARDVMKSCRVTW